MSLEKSKPWSRAAAHTGEGCQDRAKANPARSGRGRNDRLPGQRHGGVGGDGRHQPVLGLKDESSSGGPTGPTPGTSGHPARPVRPEEQSERPVVATKPGNAGGAKGPHLVDVNSEAEDSAMAAFGRLPTPENVRRLQRTLYRKAKTDRKWRAWSLSGELCRRDVLETALTAVLANAGAPGVDGVTTEQVKANRCAFLDEVQTQLRERTYRPSPVMRVWIPKADGKRRPLGIPTVKDRVVQLALVVLLTPIFEADFNEGSFGYRPGRNAHQALDAIARNLLAGRHEIIDADLSDYFGTIPHAGLLRLVVRRVSDGSILGLIKRFLKAPLVEETDGKRRISPNDRGTPQGGNLSPLMANLYLNGLDHGVNSQSELDAQLVRYADDFVLLCRPGHAPALYERLKVYLAAKGLTLNPAKTRLVDVRAGGRFRFLGFEVSWRKSDRSARWYPHVEPSHQAQQNLRANVRRELNRGTRHRSSVETVRCVNRIVRGWGQHFHHGQSRQTFARMGDWVRERFRTWLWKKHDCKHSRYGFFTNARLHGQYGLWQLPLEVPYRR